MQNNFNGSMNALSRDQYWATLPDDELVPALENRVQAYYTWVTASGRRNLWASAFNQYNAALFNGANINYSGDQNEYHMMSVNQTRNVIKHLMNLTITDRPAFEPRASNTDSKSQKQTVIARSLLQYYLREKGMEISIKGALEHAVLYGEGFVSAVWNPDDGEILGVNPDTEIQIHEGDMAYETFEPMDVIRDVALSDTASTSWWITKKFRNRWDLIARFPEHRDSILAAPTAKDPLRNFKLEQLVIVNDTDLVEVFEFYHRRTAAVPKGRYCMFIYGGDALLTSSLPYHEMPLYRLSADDIGGQPFGYGTIFDLLNIQQAVDGAYSTIQTNQETFGVQSIMAPKGSNLTTTQVTDGLNLIEYNNAPDGGKPEAIQFLQTAPETFNHLRTLEHVLEQLGGINSVVRGEPPNAGMSGAAMALLQAQAVQFVQGLQSSYIRLLEDLGTGTIATLRDYATTKRVVAIVGKSQRSNLAEFTGDDLSTINRVQVDVGSAIQRTVAGKLQIAQDLLNNKLISANEYIGVIETGNLETMLEGPMNALMSIKAENEMMTDGIDVQAVILDDHRLHMQEHQAIMSDPTVRKDPARLKAAMDHIMQHWAMWNDPANAGLLQAMGQTPPPASPQPPPAGPVPGGAPSVMETGSANAMAASMQPNQPSLPSLPPGTAATGPIQPGANPQVQ